MANWISVPLYTGSSTPNSGEIVDFGLHIGYNLADRDFALMVMGNMGGNPYYTFAKGCYYFVDGYYYFVLAVKSTEKTWLVNNGYSYNDCGYYVTKVDGMWGSTIRRIALNMSFQTPLFESDFVYISGIGQVPAEYVNPAIPLYFTLNDALQALNDGIWEVIPEDTDPYSPDGSTEPGGGGGSADPSEDITDPSLPTVSAVDTGFITLFKPSVSNLNSLATYMWSGGFDIDTFKKIMANPMDAILGLSILPGIVPSGGSSTVVIGNVSTGVSMPKVGNQYVKFNCGSKTIKRKWNAFLDYSPYTRAYIYLPYIGIHPLEVDDIMNKSVTVKYNIDVLSGGCTAFVIAGGTTLYSFTGQCACSVPVTGRDWTSLINGVLGAVTGTVGAIGSAMVGNLPGAIAGAASVAQNVLSSKPTIERSGSMGGMAGMMGIRTPYIIIERPVQAVPGKQNKYIGYPSFVTKKLGDVSGYTQVEITHLEAIPATLTEQEEIKNLLDEGVIL